MLPPCLETDRLLLRPSDPVLAEAVAAHFERNRQAHARWNPPQSAALFTVAGQRLRLADSAAAEAAGAEVGWWLALREAPDLVVGRARLTQIARGPSHSAMLGYEIDAAHEGRGLMREALQAVLADAFGARVALHRVQANVRVENARSLGLLQRLGFEREGLAREYLFIDGAWRDHVLMALRHPSWAADRAP